MIGGAFGIGFPVNCPIQGAKNPLHNRVRIVIIVAIEGCFVKKTQSQCFLTFKIIFQRSRQLFHGDFFFFEHVFFDGGQAVGYSADATALDVIGVVPRSGVVIIFPLGNAVLNYH